MLSKFWEAWNGMISMLQTLTATLSEVNDAVREGTGLDAPGAVPKLTDKKRKR